MAFEHRYRRKPSSPRFHLSALTSLSCRVRLAAWRCCWRCAAQSDLSAHAYALPALSRAYRIITDESVSSTTLSIHDTIGIHFLAARVPGRPLLAIRMPCISALAGLRCIRRLTRQCNVGLVWIPLASIPLFLTPHAAIVGVSWPQSQAQ